MNQKKIKLGDEIHRGNIDSNGFVVGYNKPGFKNRVKDYRVIGLNPNLKLQHVFYKDGFQELGLIEEFDWSMTNSLRPMFPETHLVYRLFGGEWSHIWVGDF